MKKVYLDNAASTQIRKEVIDVMVKSFTNDFGNPSSTHSHGRTSKNNLELSRKSIAKHFNVSSQEIIFTSGATEANNWILMSAIQNLKVTRIITSKIEHHAVLHAVEMLQKQFQIEVDYVKINKDGNVDILDLAEILSDTKPTIVSLMHVNNEIGTVLDLKIVAKLCKQHNAYFHSDTVQSIGKTLLDLQEIPLDFMVASAHKFHGPKGVGFLFARKGLTLNPLFFGGEQEKGLRPGTESTSSILGMAEALNLSFLNLENEKQQISSLKEYAVLQLKKHFESVKIVGDSKTSFHTILHVILPFSITKTPMILFNLDMNGIAVSRGSACQSGSIRASHVLSEIVETEDLKKPNLRISFSHFNTFDDIDHLLAALKKFNQAS
jgi:cysteine desulfurase